MRNSTPSLKQFIRNQEGLRLKAYKCSSGVWTIGYGHTRGVKQGMTTTKAQAEKWLEQDLAAFQKQVEDKVEVALKPKQLDSLTSFAYNIGLGGFERSSVLRHVNNNQFDMAAKRMKLYVRDGRNRVLAGLQKRREVEASWLTTNGDMPS